MSAQESTNTNSSQVSTRRQRFTKKLQKVGQTVQKFNIVKLIGDMERDQELADQLEDVNIDAAEEIRRKDMVREAVAKCQHEIEKHLQSFLLAHPQSTYEEWIQDLHPENVQHGKILEDLWVIDARFYVESSDHRRLWNETVPEKHVAARSYKPSGSTSVDLLDDKTDFSLDEVEL